MCIQIYLYFLIAVPETAESQPTDGEDGDGEGEEISLAQVKRVPYLYNYLLIILLTRVFDLTKICG